MPTEVSTIFKVIDKTSSALGYMAKGMEKAQKHAETLRGKVSEMLGGKLAMLGMAFGTGALAHKMWEAAKEGAALEKRLTGLWLMSGRFDKTEGGAIEKARARAHEAKESLDEMAISGYAAGDVYEGVFSSLAQGLLRTKVGTQDILGLTQNLVPAMTAWTGSAEGAQRVAFMLSQRIQYGFGRPPKELLGILRMSKKEFEALAKQPEKLVKEMQKRLGKRMPEVEKLLGGMSVQFTRIRETFKEIFEDIGTPVLKLAGEEAKKLGAWFKENRAEVKRIAEATTTNLVGGIKLAVEWGGKLVSVLGRHPALTAGAIGAVYGAPKIIGAAGALFGAGKSIVDAFKWAEKIRKVNEIAAAAGGKGASALASFGASVLRVTPWLGTLGAAAVGAGIALADLYDTWRESKELKETEKERRARAEKLDELFAAQRAARTQEQEQKLYEHREAAFRAVGVKGPLAGAAYEYEKLLEKATTARRRGETIPEIQRLVYLGKMLRKGEAILEEGSPLAQNNFDFKGSHFNITQQFAEGFDPDRIAVAFANDLAMLGERRIQAMRDVHPSSVR